MVEYIISWMQKEWGVISQAPVIFFIGVTLFGALGWMISGWAYRQRISNLDSRIDLLREQITARSPSLANGDNQVRKYDKTWEKVDGFYLWQAAWLWVGEEPRRYVPDGSRAYPAFSMLKQAALKGDLPYSPQTPGGLPNVWALVKKDGLQKLAVAKNEMPDFLKNKECLTELLSSSIILGMMKKTKVQNRSTKDDPVIKAIPLACADENAAVEFMEQQRWGGYPACPRCGSMDVYQMHGKDGSREKGYRWRCRDCARLGETKPMFSVRTGTVFEESRVPMRHWCFSFWRASTSKKGVSALEIHRQTGVSYKSALFMLHRIRYAMEPEPTNKLNGTVEVDETYVGGKPRYKGESKRGRGTNKQPVVALVERGGSVRARTVADVTAKTLKDAMRAYIDPRSRVITDELGSYHGIGSEFAGGHATVNHSAGEYVNGDVYTNTAESFFAVVKRGLNGIYHSVSKRHLHRYLAEFEFRYNGRELEDGARTMAAIKGAEGKRLMYKEPIESL